MKFSKLGRITLASVLSLAGCLGISACTTAYTSAYLYVTTTKSSPGLVNAFKIDSVSGALFPLPDSPFPSGGRNPVGIVVSPNNKYVYVINHDDSSIVQYDIGTDGKIYSQLTYNTTGAFPTALTIDPTSKFLLVAFTYQTGYTNASPGPGGIDVFPINSDGSLINEQSWAMKRAYTVGELVFDGSNVQRVTTAGTSGANTPTWNTTVAGTTVDGSVIWTNAGPSSTPVCNGSAPCLTVTSVGCNPVGISISPQGNFVYLVDQNFTPSPATCVANPGTPSSSPIANHPLVLGFSLNTAQTKLGGTLTPVLGTDATGLGFTAGTQPSGIVTNPTAQAVYVTDEASNALHQYTIGPNGSLTEGNVVLTGASPIGLTIDPLGKFLYVANFNANTINNYAIGAGGALTSVSSSASVGVGTNPTCVTTANAGKFIYTSNYTSNNVSALQLDSASGGLIGIEHTPFSTSGFPTCAATVTAYGH